MKFARNFTKGKFWFSLNKSAPEIMPKKNMKKRMKLAILAFTYPNLKYIGRYIPFNKITANNPPIRTSNVNGYTFNGMLKPVIIYAIAMYAIKPIATYANIDKYFEITISHLEIGKLFKITSHLFFSS